MFREFLMQFLVKCLTLNFVKSLGEMSICPKILRNWSLIEVLAYKFLEPKNKKSSPYRENIDTEEFFKPKIIENGFTRAEERHFENCVNFDQNLFKKYSIIA